MPGTAADRLKLLLSHLQDFYLLALRSLVEIFRRPVYLGDLLQQMSYAGFGSLLITALVTLFIGMAMALQLSAELAILGLKMYTGKVVGISIIREIGPVTVALVYTGRVGSGFASELGSMKLGQQVDSLRVFGVDPLKKLVVPRVWSSIVMLPVLTVIGDAAALLGAWYVAVYVSNQSSTVFWVNIKDALDLQNVIAGVSKPFIFGYLISVISCYTGLATRGGAVGLRKATTQAVVSSIVVIIIVDFALTRVLLYVLGFQV